MTNRREFIAAAAAAATAGCGEAGRARFRADGSRGEQTPTSVAGDAAASKRVPAAPPRNRCPYAGIDWATAHQIKTTSHVHCTTQADLDLLLKRGFGLLTLSNYYPSAPWCPLAKMKESYWRLHHDFPVVVNGSRRAGPFDWSAIVGEWADKLPPEQRAQLPFREGGPLFRPLPEGILEAPNAEHHQFLTENGKYIDRLHMNALGSAFASGTFDQRDRFKTWSVGKYAPGTGEFWKTAVSRMIAGLVHPDGGGVTVNHPTWTSVNRNFLLDLLDYDPRVLGIEVIEGAATNSERYWDWVLASGRQCFGFFVPDHSINREDGSFGVNVLVVPERSVHACLKAYRDGNFYGAKRGLGELAFTRIAFNGETVEAETDRPARLEVITAAGTVRKVEAATAVKWTLPPDYPGCGPRRGIHMFARVRATATDGSGEMLFSQPYMLAEETARMTYRTIKKAIT